MLYLYVDKQYIYNSRAYISPSAQIMQGSLVEAMATVNSGSVISTGCIIGAGSAVNHCSMCCDGVHLECNAVVADKTIVPAGTFIDSGVVYKRDTIEVNDLFFGAKPRGPVPINGREYCFEDGM